MATEWLENLKGIRDGERLPKSRQFRLAWELSEGCVSDWAVYSLSTLEAVVALLEKEG